VTVPDNSKCFAADLEAAGGALHPQIAASHLDQLSWKLSRKSNQFTKHKLCYTAAIGKWRIEDGYTEGQGSLQINLVGSYAKASDRQKILCFFEAISADSRFASD
jgi:hypothetical protein